MKKSFRQLWSEFTARISKEYQARPDFFHAALAIVSLLILLVVAILLLRSLFPASISDEEYSPTPAILATQTSDAMRQSQDTTGLTPTATFLPTITPSPIPSNLWVVNQLLGKQTIKGYTALVVEFKNLSTGELHNGQCQEPRDPAPIVGDIFVAEVTGDHILLSPTIAGTSQVDVNSKVQTFMLLR